VRKPCVAAVLVVVGLFVASCGGPEKPPPSGSINAKVVVSEKAAQFVELADTEASTIGSVANIRITLKAKKDIPYSEIWFIYKNQNGTLSNARADGPRAAGADIELEIRMGVAAEGVSVEIVDVLDKPKFLD